MADDFRSRLRKRLEENRRTFEGLYAEQLQELMGLSEQQIAAVSPETTAMQVYRDLITVVEEASAANVAQAELKENIEELGEVAVNIAKKVSGLAALFV